MSGGSSYLNPKAEHNVSNLNGRHATLSVALNPLAHLTQKKAQHQGCI